jgi:F0F1-type ATP synthase delta subunit
VHKLSISRLAKALSQIESQEKIEQIVPVFLAEIKKQKRNRDLGFLIEKIREIENQKTGKLKGIIISSEEVAAAEITKIKKLLQERLNTEKIELAWQQNKNVHGVVIEIGGCLYNFSLEKQINILENKLVS